MRLEIQVWNPERTEILLDVLPPDTHALERLPKRLEDLLQPPIQRLLLYPPDPGDIGDLELHPHPDEETVLRGKFGDRPLELGVRSPHRYGFLLGLETFIRLKLLGGLELQILVAAEAPQVLGG